VSWSFCQSASRRRRNRQRFCKPGLPTQLPIIKGLGIDPTDDSFLTWEVLVPLIGWYFPSAIPALIRDPISMLSSPARLSANAVLISDWSPGPDPDPVVRRFCRNIMRRAFSYPGGAFEVFCQPKVCCWEEVEGAMPSASAEGSHVTRYSTMGAARLPAVAVRRLVESKAVREKFLCDCGMQV